MKRVFDIIASAILLTVASPVMIGIAVVIRFAMGPPSIFRQERGGLHGRVFTIYKFRTMADGRLTRLGRFLRQTSLDELPQLWNVLKGDMSLVGPRPLMAVYLPRYDLFQLRRHEVKPGLTGWAQIQGRNAITWEQKFALDVWYVEHRTFALDLRILGRTVWNMLRRSSQAGEYDTI